MKTNIADGRASVWFTVSGGTTVLIASCRWWIYEMDFYEDTSEGPCAIYGGTSSLSLKWKVNLVT